MADPTKCRNTENEIGIFKIEDIARRSKGISVITVFGRSSENSIFFTLDNTDSSKYYAISKR